MTIPAILDAVVEFLSNSDPVRGAFTQANRTYLPLADLAEGDIETLQIYVAPYSDEISKVARDVTGEDIRVSVALVKHLGSATDPAARGMYDTAEVDSLINVAQSIALLFSPQTSPVLATNTLWLKTEWKPIYDAALLKTKIFFSVISLTFKQLNVPA